MKHANLSIFIPFAGCGHRCSFCDQNRITGAAAPPTPEEVYNLISTCASRATLVSALAQIAFFGGSFTCIPTEQMVAYLEVAAPFVERGAFSGIRISTRPDGINEEILTLLKRYHVTSIELGAQSMDPEVLRLANRGHSSDDTVIASQLIHAAGFSLGLQMLIGLPGDTKEKALRTAEQLAALNPSEMRLYPAVVFPHTDLYRAYINGSYRPLSVEEALDWCIPIASYLTDRSITLLKVGLHQADSAVAGAFHPAFGEMVRTGLFNLKLEKRLPPQPCALTIKVAPQELSIANGQKKQNLQYWAQRGYQVTFIPDPDASPLL